MNDDGTKLRGVAAASIAFGMLLGFLAGYHSGGHVQQQKATEANAGRWIVNPQTGERVFEYGKGGSKP